MFDGQLGQWIGAAYNIELRESATPYHAQLFAVLKCYEQSFIKEVLLLSFYVSKDKEVSFWRIFKGLYYFGNVLGSNTLSYCMRTL